MSGIEIAVGKVYRTRGGREVKVLRRAGAAYLRYPFMGVVLGSSQKAFWYSREGVSAETLQGDDSFDLVEQIR